MLLLACGEGVTDGYVRDPNHPQEARHRLSRIAPLTSVPELELPVTATLYVRATERAPAAASAAAAASGATAAGAAPRRGR